MDTISPLPTPRTTRRKRSSKDRLKPESVWATKIRRIFHLDQKPQRFVPYMPVPKRRGLLRVIRKIGLPLPIRKGRPVRAIEVSMPAGRSWH